MFLQFCEEDIRDAFTVFKDRFTVRKVIRELKTSMQTSTIIQQRAPPPRVSEPRTLFPNNSDPQRHFMGHSPPSLSKSYPPISYASIQQRTATLSSPSHRTESGLSNVPSPRLVIPENVAGEKRKLSVDHIKREPPELRPENTTGVCVDLRPGSDHKPVFTYSNPQLMNATVSSTEEELRSKSKAASTPPSNPHSSPYPVSLTHIIHSSSSEPREPRTMYPQHTTPPSVKTETDQQTKSEDARPADMCTWLPNRHQNDQVSQSVVNPAFVNSSSFDEHGTFMLSLVTSSICRFSAEELLAKKSVRGRPSEAQRLGTVLIRNAAQSVRIWDSAPLLKDIPQDRRDSFMRYVISTAPQLAMHSEMVWNRLREALQNRRKYLLDKEMGRRVLKSAPLVEKYEGAIPSINIADVRSLIDLTEQENEG